MLVSCSSQRIGCPAGGSVSERLAYLGAGDRERAATRGAVSGVGRL